MRSHGVVLKFFEDEIFFLIIISSLFLLKHDKIEMKRHVIVESDASPYDGNWTYWSNRKINYPETLTRVTELFKKEKVYVNSEK